MLVVRHQLSGGPFVYGLRANDAKRGKIEAFPIPKCHEDIETFLYLTTYLKTLIPGRTELARVMKAAVQWSSVTKVQDEKQEKQSRKQGRGKNKKEVVGFEWGQEQQEAFDAIKLAIAENVVTGGNPDQQYFLSVVEGPRWPHTYFRFYTRARER